MVIAGIGILGVHLKNRLDPAVKAPLKASSLVQIHPNVPLLIRRLGPIAKFADQSLDGVAKNDEVVICKAFGDKNAMRVGCDMLRAGPGPSDRCPIVKSQTALGLEIFLDARPAGSWGT